MWMLSRQEEVFFWGEEGEVGKVVDYELGEGVFEKGYMLVGVGMGVEGMYLYFMQYSVYIYDQISMLRFF